MCKRSSATPACISSSTARRKSRQADQPKIRKPLILALVPGTVLPSASCRRILWRRCSVFVTEQMLFLKSSSDRLYFRLGKGVDAPPRLASNGFAVVGSKRFIREERFSAGSPARLRSSLGNFADVACLQSEYFRDSGG